MKKSAWFFIMLLLFVGCGGQKIWKIGFIGPMTGDYANYGQLQSKSAQLAIDEFVAEHGKIGGKGIKLIVEDSQGKPEKGSAAAQKLINVDKVTGLVGPVFSGVALAVARDFEKAKIPVLSGSATNAEFTEKGAYIFRTVPSDGLQSSVLGPYIAKNLKLLTLAILYTNNDYSKALTESVTQTYESSGGKVALSIGTPEGTKDFRTQLAQVRDAAPSAIFLPNLTAESAQIIKQLRENASGLDIPIISADGFNAEVFDLIGEMANGVIFSASPQESSESAKSFQDRYKTAFNVEPDGFSANIYDGTMILLNAMKKLYDRDKKVDAAMLRDEIQNARYMGGVSGNIEFAANGDVKKGIAIMEVQNESFVTQGVYTIDNGSLQQVR